jgi:hypothetical protein
VGKDEPLYSSLRAGCSVSALAQEFPQDCLRNTDWQSARLRSLFKALIDDAMSATILLASAQSGELRRCFRVESGQFGIAIAQRAQ